MAGWCTNPFLALVIPCTLLNPSLESKRPMNHRRLCCCHFSKTPFGYPWEWDDSFPVAFVRFPPWLGLDMLTETCAYTPAPLQFTSPTVKLCIFPFFFYSRHLWLKGRSVSNFGLNRMRKCCKSLWYNCFYCTTQRQKNKPQDKRRWHRQTWWTGPFDCALHAKRPPILVWIPLVALGFPIKLVEPEGVLSEKGGGGVCVCGCVTLALWTMSFLFLADRQMFSSARILSLLIKGAQRLVPVVLCTCVYGCTG